MKIHIASLLVAWCATALAAPAAHSAGSSTLDIYFIDVEGGQSTLLVTPDGQSLLIDAGFAALGGKTGPGVPADARDANRIVAAAHDAGIKKIDYLLITHFHADHDGGVPELAQLISIGTFIDHVTVSPDAETNVPGTMQAFDAYIKARGKSPHIEPQPGDRLPLKAVDAMVVSSVKATLAKALPGAAGKNPACGASGRPAGDPHENPRSTGIVVQFGKFRFLDIGDLSGEPLFSLACPNDLIGPVDAYLVAHHGGADAAEPATFAAFKPRIAIMNNGVTKGGALATYEYLHQVRGLDDVWQLHRSEAAGKYNFADARVANLDESTAHWIKLSANQDGSFRVQNGRTGEWKNYAAR